jgi:hypothetical protein
VAQPVLQHMNRCRPRARDAVSPGSAWRARQRARHDRQQLHHSVPGGLAVVIAPAERLDPLQELASLTEGTKTAQHAGHGSRDTARLEYDHSTSSEAGVAVGFGPGEPDGRRSHRIRADHRTDAVG